MREIVMLGLMPELSRLIDSLLKALDIHSVFWAALLEKFIPLPSYILFPAIGMSASDARDVLMRCLVISAGSILGASIWYTIGAAIGPRRARALVGRYGAWILLRPSLYEHIAAGYCERPFRITFIGQLVPTVRIVQALPAGVLRVPVLPFLTATALGAQLWTVPLVVTGYVVRAQGWSGSDLGLTMIGLLLVAEAIIVAVLVAVRRWRARPDRNDHRREVTSGCATAVVLRLASPARCASPIAMTGRPTASHPGTPWSSAEPVTRRSPRAGRSG